MFQGNDAPRLSLVDPDNNTDEVAEAFKLLPAINVFRTGVGVRGLYEGQNHTEAAESESRGIPVVS